MDFLENMLNKFDETYKSNVQKFSEDLSSNSSFEDLGKILDRRSEYLSQAKSDLDKLNDLYKGF